MVDSPDAFSPVAISPVEYLAANDAVITIGEDKPVFGLFDKLQLNLRGYLMLISVLAADSVANNSMGIDKQFIYGNSLIDAITIQLGLLGNY